MDCNVKKELEIGNIFKLKILNGEYYIENLKWRIYK